MIKITCNCEEYTYNAYHMMKAFYPSAEITCGVEEKASNYVMALWEDGNVIQVTPEMLIGENADRKKRKQQVDHAYYDLLAQRSGRPLAWGMLTGIRPTKLAMGKLEAGWDRKAFLEWFQREYRVTEQKASLAWEIAGREKALLSKLNYQDGYSLYVGIPFCPTVCSYCSFSSGALADWENRVEEYLEALKKELRYISESAGSRKPDTIYMGGGTPTTLSEAQLESLLDWIAMYFPTDEVLEYTVEAGRPDSITEGKLRILKEHGVTRISINPQTMQQKTLDVIGRRHSVEQIVDAYQLARSLGFDNINMDLIAGLPGETLSDMEDTLRQIECLAPDSLTVHSLAVKRAARMTMEDMGEDVQETASVLSDMIEAAYESANRMHLVPYYLYRQKNMAGNFENVGYAKVDKAGIYNILIMEEKQSIIAAGAGASTKVVLKEPVVMPGSKKKKMTRLMRLENVKAIDAYIARVDEMIERKGEWLWR